MIYMSMTMNKAIVSKVDDKTSDDAVMRKVRHEILQVEVEHLQYKKHYTKYIEKYAKEYKGSL